MSHHCTIKTTNNRKYSVDIKQVLFIILLCFIIIDFKYDMKSPISLTQQAKIWTDNNLASWAWAFLVLYLNATYGYWNFCAFSQIFYRHFKVVSSFVFLGCCWCCCCSVVLALVVPTGMGSTAVLTVCLNFSYWQLFYLLLVETPSNLYRDFQKILHRKKSYIHTGQN